MTILMLLRKKRILTYIITLVKLIYMIISMLLGIKMLISMLLIIQIIEIIDTYNLGHGN